jgi:hypothetical protein
MPRQGPGRGRQGSMILWLQITPVTEEEGVTYSLPTLWRATGQAAFTWLRSTFLNFPDTFSATISSIVDWIARF